MVGRFERNKDLLQEAVESAATHVGRIATIITSAVVDITREIGDLVTDGVEMTEAARKARDDEYALTEPPRLAALDAGEDDEPAGDSTDRHASGGAASRDAEVDDEGSGADVVDITGMTDARAERVEAFAHDLDDDRP